ncbi:universal stress protein [Frankia sp. AiPs1]|uniref:universal stress protein n=1 Tax=Frankia sp. AiPs1 TaxID=573493 RepID=UPI0020431BB0|nr:universal stress protein [Frankia sp. AiPs1]MCM3925041.1 universal stress protein [Frankia sp. AiPs1]
MTAPASPDEAARPLALALVVGSVRAGRLGPAVAGWFAGHARDRDDVHLDVLDLAAFPLPSDMAAVPGTPPERLVRELGERLAAADGFVVVTPEYNHSYPAALKNVIDTYREEWFAKPVGFVSYGGVSGGLRAVEHLRAVFAEQHAVTVRDGVSFHGPSAADFAADGPAGRGSPASAAALRWAVDEGARRRLPVTAALVWDAVGEPPAVFDQADGADRVGLERAARRVLADTVAAVRVPDPAVLVTERVAEGSPVPELLGIATGARLVVVGERGPGALHRLVAGSVCQGVVHHAPLPVVVVRGGTDRSGQSAGTADAADAAGPATTSVDERPVVVGVDGSAGSLRALRWAVEAAAVRKTAVRAVHAWHLDVPAYPGIYADFGSALAEQAQRTLDDAVNTIIAEHGGGLPVQLVKETVADGAARALLRGAADAQLLVVGSRGHGGFAELLLGSVSHQCVAHAPCPVAVIR